MSEAKEKLDRLRAKRGGHRGVCTKLAKEALEATTTVEIGDVDRSEIIRGLLQERMKTINDIDEEILSLCDVKDIEHEIEESAEISARILSAIKVIDKFIKGQTNETIHDNNLSAASQDDVNTSSTNSATENTSDNNVSAFVATSVSENINTNTVTNSTTSTNTSPKTKLPKLSLAKFKGQVTKWNTFWDSFESAVHINQEISKVDKFNYLTSLLEGTALRAIQGLTLTGANYDAAIGILRDRFGRPQQIITAHMDELLKLPACTGDRLTSLRFIYDQISVHVRGLASLGVSSEQYGSLLIPIIMSKMPSDIRLEIARKATKDVWKIDDLLSTIKFEIEAREVSEGTKASEKTLPRTGYGSKREDGLRNQSTANSLLAGAKDGEFEVRNSKGMTGQGQGQTGFKIQCAFCNGLHYSASCDKVVMVNERKAILKKAGRCFRCLYRGHHVRDCKGPRNCRHCNGQHHQSICTTNEANQGQGQGEKSEEPAGATITSAASTNKRHVLLQTACATAVNKDGSKSVSVRVLFDNGSQRSYITDSLKSKLGLTPMKRETIHLNTFGDNKYKTQKCQVFMLKFKSPEGQIFPISALNFPVICKPLGTTFDVSDYPHLQDLELADCPTDERQCIDVLIGSDQYWDFVTGEVIKGEDGPVAISSKFGWLLSGPTKPTSFVNDTEVVNNLIISRMSEFDYSHEGPDEITNELKRFWDVEAIGICDESADDSHSIAEEFCPDISFNGQRYEVSLPWKQDRLPLSDNYESCHSRLLSLHRKLRNQPKLLSEYNKIIEDQLEAGIIERVPVIESNLPTSVGTRYSPHHPVIRQDKDTTKIRIVYDCSAKPEKQERSLNDCLETGPNFIPHIFNMLVRFRSNPIALTADIEKAFLMVGIRNEHKDMLRFLWFDDPFNLNPNTIALRFNRLMFGLRPSPSILGSVIQHHLNSYKKSEPKMAELLSKSFYVDDLLSGEVSVSKALKVYQKSKEIMTAGGFNLRKWNSNSKKVLKQIEEVESRVNYQSECVAARDDDDESYAKSTTSQGMTTANIVKLLGNRWNTNLDTIYFDFAELQIYASILPITKRSLLSLVAKFFDPLGLLSPFTVTLKILFQILCRDRLEWDQELDGELKLKFLSIQQEIIHLNSIHVPRYYFRSDTNPVTVELHGFSDASIRAYAAVVYLRSIYGDGRVHVALVAAKTRVAPTKRQSIPRLELLGALILARLTRKIKDVIGEMHTILWVDSTAALCWIKNDRDWKQYVQNRVTEIRSLTSEDSWRFCPGTENPADLPSRGLEAKELASNGTWWNGPDFLYHPLETWPKDVTTQGNDDAMTEMVKRSSEVIHTLATNEAVADNSSIANLMDINRYSNLTKLLRVTAYVLRFARNAKSRRNDQSETTTKEINALEINEAEILWIKSVQRIAFPVESKLLTRKTKQVSNTVYMTQFGLFVDESGVIRCKGRINNSSLPINCKNPIFLPSKNYFVELLILQVHNSVQHSGVRSTLTTIRERFWVLRGRESVKRVLKKCLVCTRYEGASFKTQPTPDLPEVRVADDPPFTHTGLDFAGPLYAVNGQADKGSSLEDSNAKKCYVLLLTCASTRAVHLELTRGVSVEAFLMAFRRFTSRRGLPATILSDNAKTFRAAEKQLRKVVRSPEVQRFLACKRITWKFIVERAPWWGGFWERLVRSVKTPLKKVIGRSTLSVDELQTILTETEAVINARPITYVYGDDESVSYPLTPSDLIYGRRITTQPNSSHYEVVSTNHSLTKRNRHHKIILQQLISQWRREYLTSLREHSIVKSKDSKSGEIEKNDVVIVKADSTPRSFWRLAKVEELLPGADGKVRAAQLRISGDNGKVYTTRRAVQHLVPMEVRRSTEAKGDDAPTTTDKQSGEEEHPVVPLVNSGRPRRRAAVIGEMTRRLRQ